MEFDPRGPSPDERARERRAQQVYRRRMVLGVFLLALIILIIILVIACPGDTDETSTTSSATSETTSTSLIAATYTAVLTGDDSVPPVKTDSTGKLTLTYDPEVPELTFLLEIDGLSYHHIKKAIEDSYMPNMKRLIDERGYELSLVDCGVPSSTPACQAGILQGNNVNMPAFRWMDKENNRMVARVLSDRSPAAPPSDKCAVAAAGA